MIIDYIGVKEINGSLITLDGIRDATFEETVLIRLENGTERSGRIVQMEGDRVVIQVFEGTNGLSLSNTRTRLQGHPVEMPLSPSCSAGSSTARAVPRTGWGSSSPSSGGISTAPPSIRSPGCIPATTSKPASPPSTV